MTTNSPKGKPMKPEPSAGEKIATGYFEPNTRCWRELAALIDGAIRDSNADLVEALSAIAEYGNKEGLVASELMANVMMQIAEKALARHSVKGE